MNNDKKTGVQFTDFNMLSIKIKGKLGNIADISYEERLSITGEKGGALTLEKKGATPFICKLGNKLADALQDLTELVLKNRNIAFEQADLKQVLWHKGKEASSEELELETTYTILIAYEADSKSGELKVPKSSAKFFGEDSEIFMQLINQIEISCHNYCSLGVVDYVADLDLMAADTAEVGEESF
jgi:hypothetical protein